MANSSSAKRFITVLWLHCAFLGPAVHGQPDPLHLDLLLDGFDLLGQENSQTEHRYPLLDDDAEIAVSQSGGRQESLVIVLELPVQLSRVRFLACGRSGLELPAQLLVDVGVSGYDPQFAGHLTQYLGIDQVLQVFKGNGAEVDVPAFVPVHTLQYSDTGNQVAHTELHLIDAAGPDPGR